VAVTAPLRCLLCGEELAPASTRDGTGALSAVEPHHGRAVHRCPPASRRPAGRHTAATATAPPRAKMQPSGAAPTSPALFAVIDPSGSTVGRSMLLIPALRLARATGGKVVGP